MQHLLFCSEARDHLPFRLEKGPTFIEKVQLDHSGPLIGPIILNCWYSGQQWDKAPQPQCDTGSRRTSCRGNCKAMSGRSKLMLLNMWKWKHLCSYATLFVPVSFQLAILNQILTSNKLAVKMINCMSTRTDIISVFIIYQSLGSMWQSSPLARHCSSVARKASF